MCRDPDLLSEPMQDATIGDAFTRWAQQEPSIHALVLFGSRARGSRNVTSADSGSDWDFQVVVSRPALFADAAWTLSAGMDKPIAYVARPGRLGRIIKATGVFPNGELDLVILPLHALSLARLILKLRILQFVPSVRAGMVELATVLTPGHDVMKGGAGWNKFFHRTVTCIKPHRLCNEEICLIAEAYVCDYISTRRKIDRGEFLAAQRWLHCQLAESTFRLLHEVRVRAGRTSFPDARRLEMIGRDQWFEAVTINAKPDRASLSDALEKEALVFRALVAELVGREWRWPDLSVFLEKSKSDKT